MRLRLVDRRTAAAKDDPFAGLAGREDLVAGLGRPEWTINLALVDDGEMTALNEGYRDAEGVTDVLSFSYLLPAGEGEPRLAAGDGGARRDLWLDPLEGGDAAEPVVGELVLAPGFVAARCGRQGWPLEHELPLLLVHGCLHVLGWTHDAPEDRDAMRREETKLLAAADLPHPLAGEDGRPGGSSGAASGTTGTR